MGDSKHSHIHTQSMAVYGGIFLALVALTALTYGASYMDFGSPLANELVAVGIAAVKASLVVLFFMHGRFEGKLTWAFIWYPLILLVILLAGLFLDYNTRPLHDGKVVETLYEHKPESAYHPHEKGAAAGDHGSTKADAHATPATEETKTEEATTTDDGHGDTTDHGNH